MIESKHYQLKENQLTLKVKKAPYYIRIVFLIIAILFFTIPLIGLIFNTTLGGDFHVGFLIGMFLFGILGIYILRIYLWNTRGVEVLMWTEDNISYYADYGIFKDGKKELKIKIPIQFSFQKTGYDEDNLGNLVIESEDSKLVCVTKIPIDKLDELIDILKQNKFKKYNLHR